MGKSQNEREVIELFKRFARIQERVVKQLSTGGADAAATTPKAAGGSARGRKKAKDKENQLDEEGNNEDDADEVLGQANLSSRNATMLNMTEAVRSKRPPILESTTNNARAKSGKRAQSNSTTTPRGGGGGSGGGKFVYVHRLSYSCLIKLLHLYYA